MIPSKPEQSSRRSSILKLPKARQPFQTVESNGISMDESPMKLKRRVSFAEKKHVKEFCDSMEQGTLWDSTYEESELSHTKINPPSITDNNSHNPVLSELSNVLNYQSSSQESADDNYQHYQHYQQHQSKKILTRQNAIDLDYLPIEALCSRLEPGEIDEVIISANPELLANKENIPAVLKLSRVESSLIEAEELTVERNSNYPRDFMVYCDDNTEEESEHNNLLNKTDNQDVSMDCTLPATNSILSPHISNTIVNSERQIDNLIEPTVRARVLQDNAMEISETVGTITSSIVTEVPDDLFSFRNKSMETPEVAAAVSYSTTQQSNMRMNDSMEITQAVLPSSRILTNQQQMANDGTQLFHDKSMEMTGAVVSRRPGQFIEDATQVFHNKSMEMTEAVPSIHQGLFSENKTQVFHNKSMEMTEAVASIPFLSCPRRFPDDKTEVFSKKSMEMAEATIPRRSELFSEDGTQVFHNKSMEMTEVVPSTRPGLFSGNKTQVFHNKSMEMTETMMPRRPVQLFENATQLFHNKSMEMTEAVMPRRSGQYFENGTQVFVNKSMEMTEVVPSTRRGLFSGNKTQVFHNKSMEITEAVIPRRPGQYFENETQVFVNNSMEMTAAIIPRQKSILDTTSRTEIFPNYCMEHTEPIPSLKRQYQQIANENMQLDDGMASPNAKNLRNNSITQERQIREEDLQSLHRLLHQNFDESANKIMSPSSNQSDYRNQSMEMTAAVLPYSIQPRNLNQQKSHVQNISMEMTEAIPASFTINNQTINFRNDASAPHKTEKVHVDSVHDHSNQTNIPETLHQVATSDENFNDSMEQLRFRASSVSKLLNDDVSFNFTAPIGLKNVNDQVTNHLEDVEAPSFVYADMSDDIAVLENQGRNEIEEEEEEEEDAVLIPQISITEEYNQFENCGRTRVINHNILGENEETNGSRNENIGGSSIEIIGDIHEEEFNKNASALVETNLHEDKTVYGENNRSIERNTCEVDKVVGDHELSSSSASIAKQLSQTNTIVRNNISPVKKINWEFPAVAENDLIVGRIEKQRRIMTAAAEKNSVRVIDNELELESAVVSTVSMVEKNVMNRYDILIEELNKMAGKHDCIWKINSATRNIISIEYCMTELLLGIVFNVPEHPNELEVIDRVRIVPRIADEETAILRMTDRLIVQKIDVECLRRNYKTYDDALHLIEYVTNEVNSIFDFYHELKRLKCLYSMIISEDKVSFQVWTKEMNIILKISINIKPFVDIQPADVDVICLLGSVRTNDIKDLIKNIKRNYKFLTFYINDIKDFIELMEESTSASK